MNTAEQEAVKMIGEGYRQVTLSQMDATLRSLGFKRMAGACESVARIMTGPRQGERHPLSTWSVFDRETGRSAYHRDGRRDARYHALQTYRQGAFAVSGGRIHML